MKPHFLDRLHRFANILGGFSLFVLLLFVCFAAYNDTFRSDYSNTITVVGTVKSQGIEQSTFSIEIQTVATNKEDASEKIHSASQFITAFLGTHDDCTFVMKSPNISSVRTGWIVSQIIEITTNDPQLYTHVLETSVQWRQNDIIVQLSKKKSIVNNNTNKLAEQALQYAYEKAKHLAQQSGRKLGNVINIEEGDHVHSYSTLDCEGVKEEKTFCKSITVKYRLKD